MTQAQAGMQECLVVFARSVEVLHQPPKARAIEVQERGPNVAPSWRGIFATNHGHEPFDDGFASGFLGSLKIHDFRKGADCSDQRCQPASPSNLRSPAIPSCMRLTVLVISRLVIGARSGMGQKLKNSRRANVFCYCLNSGHLSGDAILMYPISHPSLAIWQVEKSAPVHPHLHLRPSTRRVAADRHLASNAPRCSDRRYSQIWLGRTGLVFSASMIECWRCRSRSCA